MVLSTAEQEQKVEGDIPLEANLLHQQQEIITHFTL
jgi:hypothetical protein